MFYTVFIADNVVVTMRYLFVYISVLCVPDVGKFCFLYCRSLTGVEYKLIHAQLPILYIIVKQNRHSADNGMSCLYLNCDWHALNCFI